MSNFRVKKRQCQLISSDFETYRVIEGNLPGINSGAQSRDREVLCFTDSRPSVLPAYVLLLQNHKRISTSGTIERH